MVKYFSKWWYFFAFPWAFTIFDCWEDSCMIFRWSPLIFFRKLSPSPHKTMLFVLYSTIHLNFFKLALNWSKMRPKLRKEDQCSSKSQLTLEKAMVWNGDIHQTLEISNWGRHALGQKTVGINGILMDSATLVHGCIYIN